MQNTKVLELLQKSQAIFLNDHFIYTSGKHGKIYVNKDPINSNPISICVSFDYLTTIDTDVFDEKNCPMCKQNIPVNTQLGHGRKYLESKKAQ